MLGIRRLRYLCGCGQTSVAFIKKRKCLILVKYYPWLIFNQDVNLLI